MGAVSCVSYSAEVSGHFGKNVQKPTCRCPDTSAPISMRHFGTTVSNAFRSVCCTVTLNTKTTQLNSTQPEITDAGV